MSLNLARVKGLKSISAKVVNVSSPDEVFLKPFRKGLKQNDIHLGDLWTSVMKNREKV